MDTLHTLFYFVVAVGLLVAIHEFGHFWVARLVGVKVLRFSIGFGKVIFSYQKNNHSTEYVLSAIPLGGYVKMVDEREGKVDIKDLPFSFNQQPLAARAAIVAAGPVFNLLLAIILLWAVFIMGETGIRPVVGTVAENTLAAEAGFVEGEEIVAVNDQAVFTWSQTMTSLFSSAIQGEQEIVVKVKNIDGFNRFHILLISEGDALEPEKFYSKLGLKPWTPVLQPIIGKVLENSAAQVAGLQSGDLILTANGVTIKDWMQWVNLVKKNPEKSIELVVERQGLHQPITITPAKMVIDDKAIGRIGATVEIPKELINSLKVTYSLPVGEAMLAAVERTWLYASSSLQMMGKMLIGKASSDNLSGPISIAQYAGQSAEMGLVPFLKFLALVSVSLGVLNLLPIPVLDGGHLMFLTIEAIKGSPVSEKIQIYFQQIGIFMLMSLMVFATFLDIERFFQ